MMNSANLSTQADLNSLYGNWNPMAYLQGQRMLDLGDQFRQQAYQNNEQTIQADQLKNEQSAKMNPLLLDQQGLINQGQDLINRGKGISNASSGLDLSNKISLNDDQMAADRAKLKTMYSDEQLNQISNNVLKSHMENIKSGNTAKIQETGELLDFLTGAVGGKVADRVQKRNLQEGDWLNSQIIANINANSRVDAAGMRSSGKAPATWREQFAKIKTPEQKNLAAAAALTGRNPITGEQLTEEEKAFFETVLTSAVGTIDANNAARVGQGVTTNVTPDKKVELKNKEVQSSAGTSSTGSTSSGVKYKIISD